MFKVSTVDFMATHDLLSALRKIEDAPWSSEFTPEKLAKKLRTFGIRPKPNTQGNKRGYSRGDFKDAWSRYVPGYVSNPSDPSETGDEQGKRSDGLKPSDRLTCRSTSNPSDPSDTRQDETAGQTPNLTGLTGLTGIRPGNGSAARSDPGDGSGSPNAATDRNDDVCVDCGGRRAPSTTAPPSAWTAGTGARRPTFRPDRKEDQMTEEIEATIEGAMLCEEGSAVETPIEPIVITRDGYVVWDPVDGYTIGRGETRGRLRRFIDGVLYDVPAPPTFGEV